MEALNSVEMYTGGYIRGKIEANFSIPIHKAVDCSLKLALYETYVFPLTRYFKVNLKVATNFGGNNLKILLILIVKSVTLRILP